MRLSQTENAKRKKKSAAEKRKEREAKKKAETETQQAIVESVRKRKEKKAAPKPEPVKPKIDFKAGRSGAFIRRESRWGPSMPIEKRKAVVNYGVFTNAGKSRGARPRPSS